MGVYLKVRSLQSTTLFCNKIFSLYLDQRFSGGIIKSFLSSFSLTKSLIQTQPYSFFFCIHYPIFLYDYSLVLYLLGFRFYVDNIPIRVFKNKTEIGVIYPSQPMQIEASLWDGDSWATDGGQTKTNWSHAPFKAHFQGFNIVGCSPAHQDQQYCHSSKYWWNQGKYWKLNSKQQRQYENVRENYMTYDYCSDRPRYPNPPPECPQ
ncbi:Xyloglucan endotransglucosylase/hydrolase protein [Actinidia chinensis var. chinensis]|uniref:Xyloglucan endotransglucosylase/hydrolase n=1 Tax=Actinidia chinensis var. chinensis TaxID=1590841 RepID=A0A2R6P6T1_ACTCC|nr:Xyloglucan endotransglucosylase/hydrolase protein [Actinidia chinensis var. chinensis]